MKFEFATASQIIFGNGYITKLKHIVPEFGEKALLVTGSSPDRYRPVLEVLNIRGIKLEEFSIATEPTTLDIDRGVEIARKKGCDFLIGLGGGSIIDAAKAISALVPNKGDLIEYLEVIGKGRVLEENPLRFIAIPTTSGTGSEVTKNSVIKSVEKKVKVSLRSSKMYPEIALIDPEISHSMPPSLTASTGIDALTHLLEAYVSNQPNSIIDLFCREGMRRIAESLVKSFRNGSDSKARENMSYASMLGGLALANGKLGAVHGFAGPIGGMFDIPHGVVCATLLPAVLKINILRIKEQNLLTKLERYTEVSKIMTNNPEASANDLIEWAHNLNYEFNIPGLSDYGISQNHYTEIVEKAQSSSSMKGNPVELDWADLLSVLTQKA